MAASQNCDDTASRTCSYRSWKFTRFQAFAGGIVIALLHQLGASLVLDWRNPSERATDSVLGFAAGVMLSFDIALAG